jgi:hypothetical protein
MKRKLAVSRKGVDKLSRGILSMHMRTHAVPPLRCMRAGSSRHEHPRHQPRFDTPALMHLRYHTVRARVHCTGMPSGISVRRVKLATTCTHSVADQDKGFRRISRHQSAPYCIPSSRCTFMHHADRNPFLVAQANTCYRSLLCSARLLRLAIRCHAWHTSSQNRLISQICAHSD